MLENLKNIFARIFYLLNLYYEDRKETMIEKKGFEDERFSNRDICFTKRDEILKKSSNNFKNNLSESIFEDIARISEEEKNKRKLEYKKIYKEYEKYYFLGEKQKDILVLGEMLDFSNYVLSKEEDFDKILLNQISIKSSITLFSLLFIYDLFYLLHKYTFKNDLRKYNYFYQKMVTCLTLEYTKECQNKHDMGFEKIKFSSKNYIEIIKTQNIQENFINFLNIIEKDFMQKHFKNELPVIIRENFVLNEKKFEIKKPEIKKNEKEITHLCFLVHGLEGSSSDLRNMRSILQFYCPEIVFLLSEENEDDTKDNIDKMGKRLSREINAFIEYYTDRENIRISLIGHSLGGLIIRASLPYLKKYKNQFKTLITLGTPHLGCSSNNFLVSTGLKLLSKLKDYKSLREMCIEDKNEYLVKLSEKEGFDFFENVILISAFNDGYVNFQSAKIIFDNPFRDKKLNAKMVKNIYEKLKCSNVIKIGTFVPNLNKGFQYFLGREAHIDILNNNFLVHVIFSQIKNYL